MIRGGYDFLRGFTDDRYSVMIKDDDVKGRRLGTSDSGVEGFVRSEETVELLGRSMKLKIMMQRIGGVVGWLVDGELAGELIER